MLLVDGRSVGGDASEDSMVLAWSSVDSVVITNADGHVQEVNVFQLITEVPSKTREGVHLVLEMLPLLLVSGCGGNSPDVKAIINVMVMTTEVG